MVIGKKTAMMTSYTTSSQQTLTESESEEYRRDRIELIKVAIEKKMAMKTS